VVQYIRSAWAIYAGKVPPSCCSINVVSLLDSRVPEDAYSADLTTLQGKYCITVLAASGISANCRHLTTVRRYCMSEGKSFGLLLCAADLRKFHLAPRPPSIDLAPRLPHQRSSPLQAVAAQRFCTTHHLYFCSKTWCRENSKSRKKRMAQSSRGIGV
jgi:hypothetical protein